MPATEETANMRLCLNRKKSFKFGVNVPGEPTVYQRAIFYEEEEILMQLRTVWILAASMVAMGLTACDSEDNNGAGEGNNGNDFGEECASGEFRLTGNVDGVDLNLLETTRTYYMVNISEPEFAGDSTEGSLVQLYWSDSVSNNQVTEGTGTAVFSTTTGSVDAVCAKSARIVIVDSGMKFELTDLVSGDCDSTVAVEGAVSGCVNSD